MSPHMSRFTRREFVSGLTVAGAAGLLGLRPDPANAEPPPETTTIRLPRYPVDVTCTAPQWVAEELLRAEGFTDVQFITPTRNQVEALAAGELDVILGDVTSMILGLDGGAGIVLLTGVHGGCYELFGTDRVRSIRDLRGKTVLVGNPGRRAFVASMAAYVGLDPLKEITFVAPGSAYSMAPFIEGKVDALLGFPPEPQELRARKIGHVVVNTTVDRPWAQYFCCFAAANREFVRKHPAATKRALRAILKAADICAAEPDRVARFLVDRGYVKHYEYALQALREVPYKRWREYDSADTVRFYALRMHEAGAIKSSPQKIIAQGTDWRFLNELKKELKG